MRKVIPILFLIIPFFCQGQSITRIRLDSLTGALIHQIRGIPEENLYLSTDRSIYMPGEMVWFRAFLEKAITGKASWRSNHVFLRLVNQKDTVIQSLLLQSALTQMTGKMNLPVDLPGGYYWLLAYTSDMIRNHRGTAACQPIYVYNSEDRQPNFTIPSRYLSPADSPHVEFYPEGGTLITGASSLMAIKVAPQGLFRSDTGVVVDNLDQVTGRFVCDRFGVAGFSFEPSHYKTYAAQLTFDQKTFHYPLPGFHPEAGQVSVSQVSGDRVQIRVLLEDSLFRHAPETALVAISGDSLCFASIGDGNYQFALPSSKFSPGIVRFLLFSSSMQLLSERAIYVQPGISIHATLDPSPPAPNEKEGLSIHIENAQGDPIQATLSVSVVEAHFVKPLSPEASLLSAWDLAQDSLISTSEKDLLLLTRPNLYQGLSRKGGADSLFQDDSLLFIRGTIVDKSATPLPGKIVSILSREGRTFFQTDTTDKRGRFCFRLTGYSDSTRFSLRVLNIRNEKNGIHINVEPESWLHAPLPSIQKRIFDFSLRDLNRFMDTTQFLKGKGVLAPVVVTNQTNKAPDYDVTKRISRFSKILDGDQLQNSGMNRLGDALLSVGGLKLLNGFLVFGGPTGFQGVDASSEPMIVVDGVNIPVSLDGTGTSPDLNFLNSLDTRDIDFIEILTGPEGASFGVQGGHGVIVVNTRASAREPELVDKNNLVKKIQVRGFYLPETFQPLSEEPRLEKKETEFKPTLYWNGSVLTDLSGNATLHFTTHQVPGHYTLLIQGITAGGVQIEKEVDFTIH